MAATGVARLSSLEEWKTNSQEKIAEHERRLSENGTAQLERYQRLELAIRDMQAKCEVMSEQMNRVIKADGRR